MNELVVLAKVAGRRVAFDAATVRSIVDLERVIAVPGTPAHVAGLAALRSRALTVIDMQALIRAAPSDSQVHRAVILDSGGHTYALVVEEVSDVVRTESEAKPIPGQLAEGWNRIAVGLVETSAGPALLIDSGRMLGNAPAQAA